MRNAAGTAGFTLVEILLVVVIISILAALVVPRFVGRSKEAQQAAAKVQIVNFGTALDMFELDTGNYPTTEQGIEALTKEPTLPPVPQPGQWKGPYLKGSVRKDPWANPYVYASPGVHNPDFYDLASYGPDGQEGGGDDIANWDEDERP